MANTTKIQLVAIDLDGTLLNSAKEITGTTAAIIRAAHELVGVHVVLASARPPRSVLPFYSLLGLDTPMINYNGALVHEPDTGRIILHRPMEAKIARKIAAMARKMHPKVLVSGEVLDKWYTDRFEDTWLTETGRAFRPDVIAPLNEWLKQPITKLLLLGRKEWLVDIRQAVRAELPRRTATAQTEDCLLQLMHPSVGKAAALRTVAAELDIPRERVMAIGDNANDAGMLRWAGIGVAMANATPHARRAADYITDDHDADGAAKAITQLILHPAGKLATDEYG